MNLLFAIAIFVTVPSGIVWQEMKDWKPLPWKPGPVEEASRANVAEPQQKASQDHQRTGNVPPLLDTQPQTTTDQPAAQRTDREIQEEQLDTQWWMARFTGGLLFVGALQIVLIFFQVLYGGRTANAAKKSADAVKAAFQRERPYVLVTGVKLYNFERCFDFEEWRKKPYIVEARCTMKSFGKTPAIIKTVVARLGPSTSPVPEPPDFSQCVKVYDVTVEIIGAGEESYSRVVLDESEGHLTNEGWDKLKDPTSPARIDLRGVITYEDPVGEEFTTSFGYRCVWGLSGESADPYWVVVPAHSSYFKRT